MSIGTVKSTNHDIKFLIKHDIKSIALWSSSYSDELVIKTLKENIEYRYKLQNTTDADIDIAINHHLGLTNKTDRKSKLDQINASLVGNTPCQLYYNVSFEKSPKYIMNNSVDLFFCDPPYFISGNKSKNMDLSNGDRYDWDKQWNNKEEYYKWTNDWLTLAYDQMKETGSIYLCTSWEHSGKMQEILETVGFKVINRLTWKRDKGRGANRNYKSMHEDVWFAVKNEKKYKFYVDRIKTEKQVIASYRDENGEAKDWFERDGKKYRLTHPSNLWTDFTVPFWSMHEVKSYAKTKKTPNNTLQKHNTQKPKDLVKRCLLASTDENDLIVDYFSGSGTTAIAAKELNRSYIVFDVNEKCIKMLEERLKNE